MCLFQGRWIYALLACLEKPLLPEAHSSIRQLARRCAQLRSTLVGFSLHYRLLGYHTIIILVLAELLNAIFFSVYFKLHVFGAMTMSASHLRSCIDNITSHSCFVNSTAKSGRPETACPKPTHLSCCQVSTTMI